MRKTLRSRFAGVALAAMLASAGLLAVPGAHAAAYHSGPGYSMMDGAGAGYHADHPSGSYYGSGDQGGMMGYYPGGSGSGWMMGPGR